MFNPLFAIVKKSYCYDCNKFINVGIQYDNGAKMDCSKEKNEVQIDNQLDKHAVVIGGQTGRAIWASTKHDYFGTTRTRHDTIL